MGPRRKLLKELEQPSVVMQGNRQKEEGSPKAEEGTESKKTRKKHKDRLLLKISFRGWEPLLPKNKHMELLGNEDKRERTRDIISQALDFLMELGVLFMQKRFFLFESDSSHSKQQHNKKKICIP